MIRDVIRAVEVVAPSYLRYGDDPTGFQLGDSDEEVDRVLFCLEIDERVVTEAVDKGVGLIVSHHPFIFRPFKNLSFSDHLAKLTARLLTANVAVYAAHTSLDRARWGVSDALADAFGLTDLEVLEPAEDMKHFKVVVFVPVSAVESVASAMTSAGAGAIGDYTDCTFRSEGTGTFKAMEGARPHIGEIGELHYESEVRLEAVVLPDRLGAVISATLAAHPYEEVAYDVLKLENPVGGVGFGRIGRLRKETSLVELAQCCAAVLDAKVRFVGDGDARVRRVAVCGGSGDNLIRAAASKRADAFVTGDIKHHPALEAQAIGLALIDAGHHATERVVLPGFVERVSDELKRARVEVETIVSKINTDPWR